MTLKRNLRAGTPGLRGIFMEKMNFDLHVIVQRNLCMIQIPVACVVVIVYLASIADPLWGVVSGTVEAMSIYRASGPQVWFYTQRFGLFPLLDMTLTPFALSWACGSVAGPEVSGSSGRYRLDGIRAKPLCRTCG